MKLKAIKRMTTILLLTSILMITFVEPQILAYTHIAEFSGGSPTQETDEDNPSNPTDPLKGFLSESFNRNASAKENPKPYSVNEDIWNLDSMNEWADFVKVDSDSAELVIGINNEKPNSYAEIMNLIGKNGGDPVGTVSMGGEISAVVANIPLVTASSFVMKVQDAGLSKYIEPNMKFEACFVPDDPYWSQQWGPHIIEADHAWDTTLGDSSVLVAVIDTGIDYDHPDLAANYVALGYDWVNNDSNPMDDYGHGTHCAGIIAAVLNNSVGIAGLAQVRIMAEKGLDSGGWGTEDDLANAIIHAVDQGADILSNSWRGYGESALIHEAVEYAYDHGVLVIGAAGNEATSMKPFPAAYDEVIAVTATDEYDDPAWFTNFGDWVELAAPGVEIYSTMWDNTYTYMSGTSMSTPHVAGVAALIWSVFPNVTRDWVRLQLRFTADDLGDPGFDDYYGYGRINARRAVEQAPPDHELVILGWETPRFVEPGGLAIINTTVFNFGTSNETNVIVQLHANGSIVDAATIDFLETTTSEIVNCAWTPIEEGTYNLTSYMLPVPNETLTANNVVTTMVPVGYFKYIVFDQTHGTDNIVIYKTWVTDLAERGYIVDVYTSGPITPAALSNYMALIIPQAHYPYTLDELLAIQNFVIAGGGLLVIGDDAPSVYADLTDFAGISWVSGGISGITTDITPHEVTQGVTSLYLADPIAEMIVSGFAQHLVRDAWGGIMLAISEQPGRVIGFADEYSLWDYGITREDNLRLANNMIDWLVVRPEHDLVVTLDTPPYVEPGSSSLLNVTVSNRGLNNETDVELFLFINDTIVNNVTIPQLVIDSSHTLDYLWTPVGEEVMYNVTGYVVSVENETATANNLEWAYVYVGSPLKAFVLDSAGTDISGIISTWQVLSTNWYLFGDKMPYIDYSTLNKEDITYEDLAATDADVLIISCAADPISGWEFTDSEIEAIGRYVLEGHGLIATSGTFYSMVPNNNKLAPLFGLDEAKTWEVSYTDLLHLQDPTHPLFINVPNPYTFPQTATTIPPDKRWDSNELVGGEYVARGHFQESAIVVFRGLVFISPLLEYGIAPYYHFHLQLLYNAITWSSYQKPEHELVVSLEAPSRLEPGESTLLNATVSNFGLNNETDVELFLLIDGILVENATIPELLTSSSYMFSHLWTPTVEALYNITAYAPPVPGEDFTVNNLVSRIVRVCYITVALISDHSELLVIIPILDSICMCYDIYDDNRIYRYTEDLDLLLGYPTVIFYTDYRRITLNEYTALESYVSSGGSLLVTGFDSLISDDRLRNIIRSATMGDNMGEPDLYVVDETHPIMNGSYGSFPADYHISGLYSDCDAVEADKMRNAITVAELWDGYDKIITTERLYGKVVFWNGRGDYDWTRNTDCEAMLKNTLAWLAVPPVIRDVAIINVTASDTEVYEGHIVNVTVVAKNEGNINENFNITTYYDVGIIGIQSVTNLTAGENVTSTFSWDTADMGSCITYTIKAVASAVPDEIDTADNTFINGIVKVKMLGDVNDDGIVDIFDMTTTAGAFGSRRSTGDPRWDERADLNGDDIVDIFDLVLIGVNFGRKCFTLPAMTTVYVFPPSITTTVGDTFMININIHNVTGLFGYEFRLFYDTNILDVVSVDLPVGHFLTPLKPGNIYVLDKTNDTQGVVWLSVTLLQFPDELPKNGSGVLATITFQATAESSPSALHFEYPGYDYPVKLSTSPGHDPPRTGPFPIPCTAVDGYVDIINVASTTSVRFQRNISNMQ